MLSSKDRKRTLGLSVVSKNQQKQYVMTMKLRNVPFSPPDMTEAEADEVREAILSGWITTGPRTKKLEKEVAEFLSLIHI